MRDTLADGELHDLWTQRFHNSEVESFYDEQFDEIAALLRSAPPGEVLDAGCGPGHHTRRLVQRGFEVVAADFSPAALDQARQTMERDGCADRVTCVQVDLLAIAFAERAFTRILCYGVLMHVPQVARAVAELARVLAPGGVLIVSEGNMLSFDDLAFSVLNRLRGRRPVHRRTRHGLESLVQTPAGPLFIRHANVAWLVDEFERHGLRLRARLPGQFTEAYAVLPNRRLRSLVHRFNGFVRRRGTARLAFGTVLVFERPGREI